MNESQLRWKGRIGGMKSWSWLVLMFALIMVFIGGTWTYGALRNPGGPRSVTLAELVNGDVGTGLYVSVDGLAAYDWGGYEQTEDGKVEASYYFLVDVDAGNMVLVKHHDKTYYGRQTKHTTITGMTLRMPSDLANLLKEDMAELEAEDVHTTTKLYVEDQRTPPDLTSGLMLMGLFGGLAMVSAVPLFFPSVVFMPYPVQAPVPSLDQPPAVKATGTFVRLKSVKPIEVGRRRQALNNAVANLVPLQGNELMIYVHQILRSRGIKVGEHDWAIFLTQDNVLAAEPGRTVGWRDRWVVRFQYRDVAGKEATLYAFVEDESSLAWFVALLREMGFPLTQAEAA